jgi:hypothetical protein
MKLHAVAAGMVASLLAGSIASGEPMGAGKYALELDGAVAGWVHAGSAGDSASVAVRVGPGMSKAFYGWLRDAVRHHAAPRKGAFIGVDAQSKPVARQTVGDATITHVVFPALDEASKSDAKITLKLATTTKPTPAGKVPALTGETAPTKQKAWHTSNFKVEIDGLPHARVAKIDAFTIKQGVSSKLVLHLRAADAEPFRAWLKAASAKGASKAAREKSGKLIFSSADTKEPLFRLTFGGLVPGEVAMEKVVIQNENVDGARVELTVGSVRFEATPAASAKP